MAGHILVLVLVAFGFENGDEPETCRAYAQCNQGYCELKISEKDCPMTIDQCLWDSEVWLGQETLTVYGCSKDAKSLSAGVAP